MTEKKESKRTAEVADSLAAAVEAHNNAVRLARARRPRASRQNNRFFMSFPLAFVSLFPFHFPLLFFHFTYEESSLLNLIWSASTESRARFTLRTGECGPAAAYDEYVEMPDAFDAVEAERPSMVVVCSENDDSISSAPRLAGETSRRVRSMTTGLLTLLAASDEAVR